MKRNFFISTFCIMFALLLSISCMNNVKYAYADDVSTSDKASLIMDFHTGEILYENNSEDKLQVASIVKLMTTLITIEEIEKGNLSLNDKLTTTENSASMGGSQVFIDPFSTYTIDEMLKSVIVASANDAAVALAEHIGGTEENFVKMMNKRANELGLYNTIYANSTGLPMPEEFSCAKDVATLLREVIKHDIYHKYSTIWMDELVHSSGRKTEVVNTNKLIRYYKGCDSGKTGFTDEAGYCLSASAKRGDLRFIAVSLGARNANSRFENVTKLLNFAFANYENKLIISKETPIKTIPVKMSKAKNVDIYALEDYYALNKKGEVNDYELTYNLPNELKAPIKIQQEIGSVTISKNGNVVAELKLYSKTNIEKLSYKEAVTEIISNWY